MDIEAQILAKNDNYKEKYCRSDWIIKTVQLAV
jgi:hypothetical protein